MQALIPKLQHIKGYKSGDYLSLFYIVEFIHCKYEHKTSVVKSILFFVLISSFDRINKKEIAFLFTLPFQSFHFFLSQIMKFIYYAFKCMPSINENY